MGVHAFSNILVRPSRAARSSKPEAPVEPRIPSRHSKGFDSLKSKPPSFVDTKTTADLESAGGELYNWVIAIIAIIITIASVWASIPFFKANAQEGMERVQHVIAGSLIATVFGGAVFGIIALA